MSGILIAIIGIPFVVAAVVPALPGRWAGMLSLLAPAGVLALAVPLWPRVMDGSTAVVPFAGLPDLFSLDLRLDRFGVFFVLLTGGVGLATVQYARGYFGEKSSGLFWSALLAFMGAMIGLALADSLILLFVFWELTTVTSFLLIGMKFDQAESRRGAIQSFLVTGGGGLALLAGIALLGARAGTFDLSELAERSGEILADPIHRVALGLMLLGALTKSAQFPFHFWLPGAMAAPTPVSAFLHSAAMVKAGILLLGRLLPVFGASDLWEPVLVTVGLTTYVVTGWLALRATDLKELLAFSTAGFLGLITAFYGYAGREGSAGELLHILNHAMYKASLFFLVGWLDEAAGTRDLAKLESRRWRGRSRPAMILFAVGCLAMAGMPMTLGFISKEEFYEIVMGGHFERVTPALAAAVLGSALMVAYALKVFVGIFFGREEPATGEGHPPGEISRWLLIVPGVLLTVQVVGGIAPHWLLTEVLEPGHEWPESPAIWHYIDELLVISLISYGAGAAFYLGWHLAWKAPGVPGPQAAADASAKATAGGAAWLSRAVQAGGHPRYLAVILVAISAVTAFEMGRGGTTLSDLVGPWGPDLLMGMVFALLVAAGGLLMLAMPGRLPKILLLSILGFGAIGVYVLFRAPDLALTQVLTDTISMIMLLLIVRNLPRVRPDSRRWPRALSHGVASIAVGLAMAALTWSAATHSADRRSGDAQILLAEPEAGGKNVVNVILTDFRAADTLGEVTVLAIAALGVAALYRAGRDRGDGGPKAGDREGAS